MIGQVCFKIFGSLAAYILTYSSVKSSFFSKFLFSTIAKTCVEYILRIDRNDITFNLYFF